MKTALAVLLAAAFCVLWTGCGHKKAAVADGGGMIAGEKTGGGTIPAETPADDEFVPLIMYTLGDPPAGLDDVVSEINKKLKRDINASLEIKYVDWGQMSTKYAEIIASGEQADIAFMADWLPYRRLAASGALRALELREIRTYMPKKWTALDENAWKAAREDGAVYMIPSTTPERDITVALFRKDIMDEAGMSGIGRFSEAGPYFECVKNNHPDMRGMMLFYDFDIAAPYQFLCLEKAAYPRETLDSRNTGVQGVTYDFNDPSGKIRATVEEPFLSAQKYAARIMKQWHDSGYVFHGREYGLVRSKDNFRRGNAGVMFSSSDEAWDVMREFAENGIDTVLLPMVSPEGNYTMLNWLNCGLVITSACKRPERAMQAIDLLMEDEEYAYLEYFGIEGVNYVKTPNGKIALPEGALHSDNTYSAAASTLWFVNTDFFPALAEWTPMYADFRERLPRMFTDHAYNSFAFDWSGLEDELLSITRISNEYSDPIYLGDVADVDAAFDEMTALLWDAGLEKVKREVQKQAEVFLAAKSEALDANSR